MGTSSISKTRNNQDGRGYRVGQLVVDLSNELQLRITEITPHGTYVCQRVGDGLRAGEYRGGQIEDFDHYWARNRR